MTQGTLCFEKALGGLVATIPLWTDFRVCNRADSHRDLPTPSHMRRNGPTWTVHTRRTPFTLSPTSSRSFCSNMYIFPLFLIIFSLSQVSFFSCGTTRSHWGPGGMGFFFAFSFSCHENRRRAHGRTVERMRAVSRGGWQSVMRTVKGKVRVAGQDRSRDRDKDRMEGRGRRFLSMMLKHRFFFNDIFAPAAAADW